MAIENWCDAPEIHPSQIRVGDTIGSLLPTEVRYTVRMISGPQTKQQWTFFCRDARGSQHANTFGDGDMVRRYAKAS
jgi:hypothetical protein